VQGADQERFEFDLKWSANSMYSASIDTVRLHLLFHPSSPPHKYGCALQTITSISHFILAMLLHPEAQRRAQAELDAVVGADRLPTIEDRGKMPFGACGCSLVCVMLLTAWFFVFCSGGDL
jgi:hypothetical protein